MISLRHLLVLPSLASALVLSSCVSIVKTADEPKESVTFSSARAAQTFYETTYVTESRGENGGSLNMTLPIVLPSYRENDGPQLTYNKAVRAADANGDTHITTAEAQAYADSKKNKDED